MSTRRSGQITEEAIIGRFAEFFDEKRWCYHREPGESVLWLGFNGRQCKFECAARVELCESLQCRLSFVSILPVNVPQSRQLVCAELLKHINRKLTEGAFNLDLNNGEISFRICLALSPKDASRQAIEHLVMAVLFYFEEYFEPIMLVLYGEASAEAALKHQDPRRKPPLQPGRNGFELN